MALYTHHDTVDTVDGQTTAVERGRRFSPGQLVTGALGVLLVIFGIIALTRTGVDGSLNTPPTDILGLAHSAWVGFAELALGLLLIVGSADAGFRGLAGAIGVLMVIAGVVVAAGTTKMLLDIGTERATGWFFVVMGAIALAATMLPSVVRRERVVRTDHY